MKKIEKLAEEMKTCTQCKRTLPKDSFCRWCLSPDGLAPQCRECRKKDRMRYACLNRDQVRESSRRRRAKNPELMRKQDAENAKRMRLKHKKKASVRKMVGYRVSNGIIKPLPCAFCGETKTVAHHNDYDKPLELLWLCTSHHRAWHRLFIAENTQ